MPVTPDADLVDADWPKQTWDLVDVPLDHWQSVPIAVIEQMRSLPSFDAAPDDVREVFEQRLAEVAD